MVVTTSKKRKKSRKQSVNDIVFEGTGEGTQIKGSKFTMRLLLIIVLYSLFIFMSVLHQVHCMSNGKFILFYMYTKCTSSLLIIQTYIMYHPFFPLFSSPKILILITLFFFLIFQPIKSVFRGQNQSFFLFYNNINLLKIYMLMLYFPFFVFLFFFF